MSVPAGIYLCSILAVFRFQTYTYRETEIKRGGKRESNMHTQITENGRVGGRKNYTHTRRQGRHERELQNRQVGESVCERERESRIHAHTQFNFNA